MRRTFTPHFESKRLTALLPHIQSHQSLDHLFPYRFVHREKQSHFHGEAKKILDDTGQEDGRSRLVIVEDQPEGIETQMDQKHDKKKRHTDIGKSDLLMIEKPAKQKARQKIRQREAGKKMLVPMIAVPMRLSSAPTSPAFHGP